MTTKVLDAMLDEFFVFLFFFSFCMHIHEQLYLCTLNVDILVFHSVVDALDCTDIVSST